MHGLEEPYYCGERELSITTLLLLSYVALFLTQRPNQVAWMLPMCFALLFAASIRPTFAPLPLYWWQLLPERSFPYGRGLQDREQGPYAYRIYARTGTAFADAQLLPAPVYTCPSL